MTILLIAQSEQRVAENVQVLVQPPTSPGNALVWAAVVAAFGSLAVLLIGQAITVFLKYRDERRSQAAQTRERLSAAYGESAYHLRKLVALSTAGDNSKIPHHLAEAQRHLLFLATLQTDDGLRNKCLDHIRHLAISVGGLSDPTRQGVLTHQCTGAAEFLGELILHDARLTDRPGPPPT